MPSTFNGIYIGLSGLRAQQTAINVTGHNIANVNTPGYSRQRVVLKTNTPYAMPGLNRPIGAGQLGTGVSVAAIERVRDRFVEMQIRSETQTTGRWKQLQAGLEKIEMIFNEPSDTGIATAMDLFWTSLQNLSQRPEDMAARAAVRQNAELLVEAFHHTANQLDRYRAELNEAVQIQVEQINYIGRQLADLNKQIIAISATGDSPNDLLDQRDLLLSELSELVNIYVTEDERGSVTVSIGGSSLVEDASFHALTTVLRDPHLDPRGAGGILEVRWADHEGVSPQFTNGSMQALLELRDEILPRYQEYLDAFAVEFANKFNAIHEQGYTLGDAKTESRQGVSFFVFDPQPPRAKSLQLSLEIRTSLNNIAAAAEETNKHDMDESIDPEAGSGDNRNLLKLLEMRDAVYPFNGRTGTFSDHFAAIIAELGIDSQRAQRLVENQEVLLRHLEDQRESISGVSLDEEVANLVLYQHAYSAAARVITTVDETLDILINRMGLVGR